MSGTASLTLWNYVVRDDAGAWLADVVLRSDGFFAAVSEFTPRGAGYAFRWHAYGRNLRNFILRIAPDYLHTKIGAEDVLDAAAAKARVLEEIGRHADDEIRDREKELLEEHDFDHPGDFDRWLGETALIEPWRFHETMPEPHSWRFCAEVLPRLQTLVRAELEQEGGATAESRPRLVSQVRQGDEARHLEQPLRAMGDRVRAALPPGLGFTMFLFDVRQPGQAPGTPAHISYISTADRGEMVAVIRDWLGMVSP